MATCHGSGMCCAIFFQFPLLCYPVVKIALVTCMFPALPHMGKKFEWKFLDWPSQRGSCQPASRHYSHNRKKLSSRNLTGFAR